MVERSRLEGSEYFVQKNGLSESADSATSSSDYPSCAKFFDYKILLCPAHSLKIFNVCFEN